MPVIIFEGPKMTKEQKEALVKEFANSASQITKIAPEAFVTLIKESDPENVGVGTILLADRVKK
ncbi:4-oxalocrotonate tautomerase DmpI [Phosphitispora sp. TUW77]|uniref:4-oxalocrotonate tautomerase DmpI n=1 Tax=Phosphitispora sp. TUW77 TaxID=3152361 RepID=UPI003AB5D25E